MSGLFFSVLEPIVLRDDDDDDSPIIKELERDISGSKYWDPICDPPTQELDGLEVGIRYEHTTSRYTIVPSRNSWPLEHMFAAVCRHIRKRVPIPRYIVLPEMQYRKHIQDPLVPRPFDGLFLFRISGMERPFSILVYKDTDFNITLPVDAILCID